MSDTIVTFKRDWNRKQTPMKCKTVFTKLLLLANKWQFHKWFQCWHLFYLAVDIFSILLFFIKDMSLKSSVIQNFTLFYGSNMPQLSLYPLSLSHTHSISVCLSLSHTHTLARMHTRVHARTCVCVWGSVRAHAGARVVCGPKVWFDYHSVKTGWMSSFFPYCIESVGY